MHKPLRCIVGNDKGSERLLASSNLHHTLLDKIDLIVV